MKERGEKEKKVGTVKSCIKAAVYVQFFNFLVRLLFKGGLYADKVLRLQNP